MNVPEGFVLDAPLPRAGGVGAGLPDGFVLNAAPRLDEVPKGFVTVGDRASLNALLEPDLPEVRTLPADPVNLTASTIQAVNDQSIPPAEPVVRRAMAVSPEGGVDLEGQDALALNVPQDARALIPEGFVLDAPPDARSFIPEGFELDPSERPEGFFDAVKRAAQRGWMSGETAVEMSHGVMDAEGIARRQRRIAALRGTEDFEKTWDDGVEAGESFDAFVRDPIGNLAQLTAESLGTMARTQLDTIGKVPERAAQGMVGAATAGMVGGGPPGAAAMVVPGALVGGSAGFAESAMLASHAAEYSGAFLDALSESGVDITNATAMKNALLDSNTVAEIRASAERKAVPIGIVDGLMTAIGGRLFASPAKKVMGKAVQWAGELGVQAVGGMAGEVAGQVNQKGKVTSVKSVLAEGVGEIGGSVASVAVGRIRLPDRAGKVAVEGGSKTMVVGGSEVAMKPAAKAGTTSETLGGPAAAGSRENVSQEANNVNPEEAYMRPEDRTQRESAAEGSSKSTNPEEALSPDAKTQPRAIEWLKPETKGNPSLRGIRNFLKRALDVPIRQGMRVSKGAQSALGVYRIRPETIRMRALNDVPTLMHEVGHYLHHMIFPEGENRGKAQSFAGVYDGELMPLGAVTSTPAYSPQMVRLEGVAEWFRIWVANPAAARVAAPNFTQHFETTVATEYPQMARILGTLQERVRQYMDQPTKAKAMGMIAWEPEQKRGNFSQWLKDQYTAWFHELAPIERAMDKLVEFGLPKDRAQVVVNLVNNYKGGWKSKADYDLEFAQTDLHGNVVGPSMKSILAQVDDQKEFATYAALRRALEKSRQGVQTGFEEVMGAKDFWSMMKDWEGRFEPARRLLVAYTENQMRMLEQAGLISADQVKAMRDANKDYVPFYRVHDSVTGAGRKGGKGYVNASSGVMRMKGSDLEIMNPIESVVKNTMLFRDLAERNRAGAAFVKAVRETQGGGRVGEVVLQPMKAQNVSDAEVRAKLRESGLVLPPGAAADLGFAIFRAVRGANAKEGTFEVMVDGKPQVFQVEDRELLRALSMMDSLDAEIFNRMPFLKVMRGFTSVLRAGATLTPEFLIRNPFRDQVVAGVYSKHGYVPFVDGFRGIFSMLKKDDLYKEWLRAGGKYGGLYNVEVNDTLGVMRAVGAQNRSAVERAAALLDPRNVLRALAAAGEVMESGTRISEYRRAREQGLDAGAAAMASKDVTLNFSRAGYRGAVTNKMVAFFNAALQDMDKMGRTFRERPVAASAKALTYITVPSMLVWWLGKDDPEIDDLPEWRKAFFWNVNLREWAGTDFILTVPKPFLMGALFGTSAEKGLDLVYKKDPNAVHKWFQAVMQNTLFRGDAGIATAVKPLLENLTNYSFFRDAPLENQAQRVLSPEMRFNPSTSLTARFAGEKFGASPLMIDNAVRGYLGGLSRYGTDAIDYFLVKSNLMEVPPQPPKDPRELPFVKALMVPKDAGSESVARFYRAMELAENRIRDFKVLGDRMETPKQKGFWMKNRNELMYYGTVMGDVPMMTHLRRTQGQLSEINKAMMYVQNTRKMSPESKRDRLDLLERQRMEIAKRAFERGFHPKDRARAF